MIPPHLLVENVVVRRRIEVGRDSLNNPEYGDATMGEGWNIIYRDMPVRLAFSGKDVRFAPEGERILPTGIMYFNTPYLLKNEDRILTPNGIEYIVIGLTTAYLLGTVVDHHEAILQLP